MILLETKDLSITYESTSGIVQAVKNISFYLQENEILGILGESASGKTTLAEALIPQLVSKKNHKISGTIEYNKEDLCFSLIPQDPLLALNPTKKIGKQIAENLSKSLSRRERKQAVFNLLQEVQIENPTSSFHLYPHQMSRGMLQRVILAMGLAKNARIFIVDEPTTALDAILKKETLALFQRVQKKNRFSVIFISHDPAIISEFCDRLLILSKGEVIEQGDIQTLKREAKHPYTKLLLTKNSVIKETTPSKTISIPFLSFQKITKSYKQKKQLLHVLKDISFSIYRGECLGLVGESGSGKTTLAKIALHLLSPSSGEILLEGENLLHSLSSNRKKMQMIFQDPHHSLDPRKKIKQILKEPLIINRIADKEKRIEEMLESVALPSSILDRYPHELSGGQKQRINIARALANDSLSFLILDEPTSSLDIPLQREILELLISLQKRLNLTYLFITHDLELLQNIATRIVVLFRGRIVEIASTLRLFTAPIHPYTRLLLQQNIKKENTLKKSFESGCSFFPLCPYHQKICMQKQPLLKEIARDHLVSCHLESPLQSKLQEEEI